MSVVSTDKWLDKLYWQPLEICERLQANFESNVTAEEIYMYLCLHGMCRKPMRKMQQQLEKWKRENIWGFVHKEEQKLKKLWNGPDIPIFIFPADTNNIRIMRDQNGKSGVAFKDKLFLFLPEYNNENEIRALLTHEYNHVCRLANTQNDENEYVLLDSIIMEGLAENAVQELVGRKYVAKWTTYYSDTQLEHMWKKIIHPNRHIPIAHQKHQDFLYGHRMLPKMIGYCVGYYLVRKYVERNKVTSKELLRTKTDIIAQT